MKLRRIFQMPMKTRPFPEGVTFDRIRTITFKNGGPCVRVLRCHQGSLRLQFGWASNLRGRSTGFESL